MYNAFFMNQKPLPEIDIEGNVFYKNILIPAISNKKGIKEVIIQENGINYHFPVHLLMRNRFFQNYQGKVVVYKNYDKADNRLVNLDLLTRAEFIKYLRKRKKVLKH